MKILLVGGSKSGKSHLAQDIVKNLANGGNMVYFAAMEPVDSEDDERIEKHREDRRGWGFTTVEMGRNIGRANIPSDSSVLFDSVTALLANEMFSEGFNENAADVTLSELLALGSSCKNLVCVADEVFRDGVEYVETTEFYRKGLAFVLRRLSERFDSVAEVTAGIPKLFKGKLPL